MSEGNEKEKLWMEIEQVYICTGTSLRELSRKYGLSYSSIRNRSIKDAWGRKREAMKKHNSRIMSDFAIAQMEDRVKQALKISSVALDKLEIAIDSIDAKDTEATKKIKEITISMKNLKEIGIIRVALDKEEQLARIAKLRKDAQEEFVDREITVVFESEKIEEYGA